MMHAMTLTFMVLNESRDQRTAEVISAELTVHRVGKRVKYRKCCELKPTWAEITQILYNFKLTHQKEN